MRKLFLILFILMASLSLCSCENSKVALLSTQAMFARNNADLNSAERLYKEIIAIQPHVAEHHWELGTLYVSKRERNLARQQVKKLREMNRDDLADTLEEIIDLQAKSERSL